MDLENSFDIERKSKKTPAVNERFGVMAAVARRKCSANLQVSAPQEVQWKPPLRQAATTLAVMHGQCSALGNLKKKRKYD